MLRKIASGLLIGTILLSSLTTIKVSAWTKLNGKSINVDSNISKAESNSYSSYIKKIGESTALENTIEKNLQINLSNNEQTFDVNIDKSGLYSFLMEYKAIDSGTSDLTVSLKIAGKSPFEEAEALKFPRFWSTDGEHRVDGLGNEFSPEIVPFKEYMKSSAVDSSGWSTEEYKFFLSEGNHSVSLSMVEGKIDLKSVCFYSSKDRTDDEQITKNDYYSGEQIVIEAEKPSVMSSYWLIPKSDNTSAMATPASEVTNKVNYIGGGNWKSAGESIFWDVDIKESGYYKIGATYRQSAVINGSTYRMLKVDGEVPFKGAEQLAFKYSTEWNNQTFVSNDEKPYLIYLSKGTHILSLTATPGPIADISLGLKDIVSELGDLYMDITMITGETIDNNRDYELFSSVSNMENRIKSCFNGLNNTSKKLSNLGQQGSGSYDSSIKSMMQILKKMLDNKFTAHRYVTEFYSKYCSLASSLNEMREMPLDIDRIILAAPDSDIKYKNVGFFEQLVFSSKKFISSFLGDYNNISGVKDGDEHLTIWVNWGRDQAQVLNSLIQSEFTPKYSMNVDVKVTNATIVQSVLSGNQPDIILQQARSEPVNLALRGVLADLSKFDDFDEVMKRFHSGAEIPYTYNGGVYALPDTQTFNLMFYRTDVLGKLGIDVPETWEEFLTACRLLSRNNLQCWLPYTQITTTTQVNTGIGSLTLFPCLLIQNDLDLYSKDGKTSNLSNTSVIKTFEYWTNFYTKMKLPVTMNFYNRFRTGTCPLGIGQYTTYTTLKAAAPEIDGLWSVASIPGMVKEDGSINCASSGGGTGCCILKSTHNLEKAWNFLKWWTDTDTQVSYTNNLESVLGPTGRVALSNVSAFEKLSWDANMKNEILKAWDHVEEVPEVPGSYYAARAIDLAFWSVVNENLNPKDVLLKRSVEVDAEISRKWKQYENR